MKPLVTFAVSGIVATVASRPVLAEAGVVEPVWTQVSALAVLASLLWYAMTRTIPQLSADHKEAAVKVAIDTRAAMDKLTDEHKESTALVVASVESVRAEIRAGNDSTFAMHRQFSDKIVALLDEKHKA